MEPGPALHGPLMNPTSQGLSGLTLNYLAEGAISQPCPLGGEGESQALCPVGDGLSCDGGWTSALKKPRVIGDLKASG